MLHLLLLLLCAVRAEMEDSCLLSARRFPGPDELEVKRVEAAHAEAVGMKTPCADFEGLEASRCIIGKVKDVFETLQSSSDLSPRSLQVDQALTSLVSMVLLHESPEVVKAVLANEDVQQLSERLRNYLSSAEFEMEAWWARRFLEEEATMDRTESFWYRENYRELTKLELAHVKKVGHLPHAGDHVVFVGGGPLPFSAVEYFLQTGARTTVVDNNPEAIKLSKALLLQLGLAGNIRVVNADGENFDYKGATHLIIAALVRNEGVVIPQAMKTASLSMIGVRSADGLRSILYQPLDVAVQNLGIKCTGESSVNERVINTLVTFDLLEAPDV